MYDTLQRLGLWLARWAGWSEQSLIAPQRLQLAALTQQVDDLLRDKDARNQDVLALQSERTQYREQIAAHLKNVAALDQHATDLRQQLAAKDTEIATLQSLVAAKGIPVSEPVFARATQLTQEADTTLIGGEAKRHAVYAKLIKDFPAVNKRELALSIELALFGKEPQSP